MYDLNDNQKFYKLVLISMEKRLTVLYLRNGRLKSLI